MYIALVLARPTLSPVDYLESDNQKAEAQEWASHETVEGGQSKGASTTMLHDVAANVVK